MLSNGCGRNQFSRVSVPVLFDRSINIYIDIYIFLFGKRSVPSLGR